MSAWSTVKMWADEAVAEYFRPMAYAPLQYARFMFFVAAMGLLVWTVDAVLR